MFKTKSTYVKYAKSLQYLLLIVERLSGTVDQTNIHQYMRHWEVKKIAGRYKLKMIAVHSIWEVGRVHLLDVTGISSYQTHARADWSILGKPVWTEVSV